VRQIVVLGTLLVASLAGSYWAWTREEADPKDADKVAVYRAEEGDLQKIVYKAEDTTVEIAKKNDGSGDYLWVVATETVTKKTPPKAEGDTDAPAEEPAAEKEVKTAVFKGNETADDVWKSFAPLLALRELQPGEDATVFGLDAPKASVEVTRAAGALMLQIGGETWGSRDRYVGVEGKVFLVDDATLRPLQYAKTRLVDRNLQPIAEADLASITLTRGGSTVVFQQKNKEDRAKAFWARGDAAAEDAVAATWLDKLLKLRVQTYVGEGEAPASLEPLFSVKTEGKGEAWTIEVSKGADGEYYASSSWNRGLVKLTKSLAAEAVADLDSVMSGSGAVTPAEGDGHGH
jgi:hypothetical protein